MNDDVATPAVVEKGRGGSTVVQPLQRAHWLSACGSEKNDHEWKWRVGEEIQQTRENEQQHLTQRMRNVWTQCIMLAAVMGHSVLACVPRGARWLAIAGRAHTSPHGYSPARGWISAVGSRPAAHWTTRHEPNSILLSKLGDAGIRGPGRHPNGRKEKLRPFGCLVRPFGCSLGPLFLYGFMLVLWRYRQGCWLRSFGCPFCFCFCF